MIMPLKLIQRNSMHIFIKVVYRSISGDALNKLGKFDKAIEMYDHALKINPNEYSAYD